MLEDWFSMFLSKYLLPKMHSTVTWLFLSNESTEKVLTKCSVYLLCGYGAPDCWFLPLENRCMTQSKLMCQHSTLHSVERFRFVRECNSFRCNGQWMSPQNLCKGRQRSGCAVRPYVLPFIMNFKIRISGGRRSCLTYAVVLCDVPIPPPVGNMTANVNVNQSKIDYRNLCSLRRETFTIRTNSLAHYLLIQLKCLAHLITRYSTIGTRKSVCVLIWATHQMHLRFSN